MTPRKATAAALAAVASIALLTAGGAAADNARPAAASWGHSIDVSPRVETSAEIGRPVTLRALAKRYIATHPNRSESVPAQQSTRRPTTASTMPAPASVFQGISNSTFIAPPDPNGDVSATQYVESVNSDKGALVAVFDKSGAVLAGPLKMERLWDKHSQCGKNGQGDPVVQYDQMADRWVLTQFAFTYGDQVEGPFYECVAVSETGDATGLYYAYDFKLSKTQLPDYPKLGVWPDGYYMSVHLFSGGGSRFRAQGVVVFDRERMIQGRPARGIIIVENKALFGLLPADAQGPIPPPAGAPNYMAVLRDDNAGDRSDAVLLFGFHADWAHPDQVDINGPTTMAAAPFNSNLCNGNFYCLPQKGTSVRLDAIGAQPKKGPYQMYPLAYRNYGDHESLVLNHTVRGPTSRQAAINWFELRQPGPGATIYQQGTYAPDGASRWVGSIGMDHQNDIAVGFALSSKSMYPSIAYAGRLADDPLGELAQGEHLMVAGRGAQEGLSRWGDYSSISIDPVDDCTFWYVNEYYARSSLTHWRTAIGSFRFPSCTSSSPSGSPPPTTTSSPSATASATP